MREYGQIQCSFWTDPEIQALSDQARVLACYLLTGPHSNGLGCYRIPDGYIQADFGWTAERVSKGFAELFQIGFCERCETTQFVMIPKFMRWNPTANPKVAAAREKEFNAVPKKASFYQRLIEEIQQYGRHLSEPFANRIETLSKQEPTRTEPEPNQRGKEVVTPGKPDRDDNSPKANESVRIVFDYWRDVHDHPRSKLDVKRRKLIKARLDDGYSVEDLFTAINGCKRSDFHQGDNKEGKVYDGLDLICRDGAHVDQFIKIAEDNSNPAGMGKAGRATARAAAEWLGDGTNG